VEKNRQISDKTDNLNLKQLLKEAEDKEWDMPAGTVIGHIHLQVSDLIKSSNFYSNVLGLHHTCSYPGANFFAADSYHHHIAINTWFGNGLSNADLKKPGLDYFSLNLGFKEKFDELVNHMQRMKIQILINDSSGSNNESFFILDPNRIKIKIYYQ
jgi:catechol 2,3-dioxygenase